MPYLGVRPADITSAAEAEIAGDLTVDTNTLKVDSSNNRVGVGTAAPNGNGALTVNAATNNSPQIVFTENDTAKWLVGHRHDGDHFRFFDLANSAERLRIQSGGGISFNGDTAASNALDDYEEGNWTPSYTTTDGTGFSSIGHHAQYGRYVRVGKQVHAWFYLATNALTKGSASGSVVVIGLPYTVENVDYQSGTIGYSSSWVTNHPITLLGGPNTTQMFIYHTNGSTNHVNSSPANMVDHSGNNKHYLYGALSYRSA